MLQFVITDILSRTDGELKVELNEKLVANAQGLELVAIGLFFNGFVS